MSTNETSGSPSIAESFSPGQVLAESLTLKQKLSQGDTGILWLAHDGASNQDVALLFLPGVLLGDKRVMEELRAQVKINRQLIHPRVLRTHDFIEEEGWAAISSDAADAETLASLLAKKEKGRFEPSEIKAWLAAVCQTLDDAHRASLLHRDLVPQNILLTKSGELLVANFGVSRIILDAVARARGPGKVDEHLASMSPQQLDGELPARWDDVYALGTLIYHLLTGKPPFYSGDILPQIRKTVPPSITDRRAELGIAGEQVPPAWEKVVASCLEKHTPQRPKSAREIGVKLGTDAGTVQAASAPAPAAAPVQISARVETKAPVEAKAPQEPVEAKKTGKPVEKPAKAAASKKIEEPKEPAKPAPVEKAEESDKSTESSGDDVHDIVWRKPVQRPQPAPGEAPSFKHLLQKMPEEQETKKESPIRKIVVGLLIVATTIGVFLWASGWPSQKPLVPPAPGNSPTPAVKVTPAKAATPLAGTTPEAVPSTTPVATTPAPTPQMTNAIPTATPAMLPPAVPPEKLRALEQIRKIVADSQQAVKDKTTAQQKADSDAAAAKSVFDAKTAALEAIKKASDDMETLHKQREDEATKAVADATKAVADAEAAQKAAAEKARIASEAAAARDQIMGQIKDQEETKKKADAEIVDLQKAAAGKQDAAATAAKAEKDAETMLQSQMALLKQAEDDVSQQNFAPSPQPSGTSMATTSGTDDAQMVPITPDGTNGSIEQREQNVLNIIQSKQNPAGATPAPPVAPTEPVTYVSDPKSQIDQTLTNSLGMKFQPVGNVLFSIWLTRVEDFEAFAKATHFKGTSWLQPGFKQGPDHPVVFVTWNDAVAFCKWLTDKDHESGLLAPNQIYRLPTDLEWSKAVGLPEETGKTPDERDVGVKEVYPWGKQWPPPEHAGNYNGEETGSDVSIKGYNDGFPFTSPVGSFAVNKYGLYDMGGNAWEWCMDWLNGAQKQKVLRGASWYSGDLQLTLLASCRWQSAPDLSSDDYGFRCVVATETKPKR